MAKKTAIARIQATAKQAATMELSASVATGDTVYCYKLSTYYPNGLWMTEVEEGQDISSSEAYYREPGESLAEFWPRVMENAVGGELLLGSISARSNDSPLNGKELREVAIEAWCKLLGRALPTAEEMKEAQRKKREANRDKKEEKEREQKTLSCATRQDLWAEIVANPDDDEPRLVYADWLEENGLADQADFIRRHLQLPEDQSDDMDASIEEQLTHKQKESWSHIPEINTLDFNRGFVARLGITLRQFIKHSAEIEERIPALSHLSLGGSNDKLGQLAEVSALSLVRSLHLILVAPPDLEGWRKLLDSPHLADLKELNLTSSQMKQTFWTELYQSDLLQRLESLWLHSARVSGASLKRLLDSLENCRLQRLCLAFNSTGMRGLQSIVDCPELSGLTELDLTRTGIDDSAVDLLAACPHLKSLRCLKVGWDDLTESRWRELLSSENLPALSEFHLQDSIFFRDGESGPKAWRQL